MPKKFVVDQDDLPETEPTECCAMCGKDIFTGPFCEECDNETNFGITLEELTDEHDDD
ncbi:hypothetical protein [Mesorhizobium sp. M8A.F.Ca.ET.021.01.1.1]|uniref:hypothetical protein n=1 Tax=Mesorhizobium sp. M8A.F.Ca.ET.021.01.1.1 TaxID=2496757 RepID=UPI0016779689|nr:hypothetical protein [Mesorhizobium sp. M8A.F.Ca.ET.021.01.1.1]